MSCSMMFPRFRIRSLLRIAGGDDAEASDEALCQLLIVLAQDHSDNNKRRLVEENGVPIVIKRWSNPSARAILRLLCSHPASCRVLVTKHQFLQHLHQWVVANLAKDQAIECVRMIQDQHLHELAQSRELTNILLSAAANGTKTSHSAAANNTFFATGSTTHNDMNTIASTTVTTEAASNSSIPRANDSPTANTNIISIEEYYTIHPTRSLGHNLFAAQTKGFFPKDAMVKLYPPQLLARGQNARNQLQLLSSLKESGQYVATAMDFKAQVLFNHEICSVLVLEPAQTTLLKIVQELRASLLLEFLIPTMKKIAESLHFLHAETNLVHGDVRLESVVNFGSGFPLWKLINFEYCRTSGQPMSFDCGPGYCAEYCPPELAVQFLDNNFSCFSASSSLDVYCFGVLWLKYMVNGHVLTEFAGLNNDKTRIWKRICEQTFSFDQTFQTLALPQPMESLLRECTHRDPSKRPSFKIILKHYVIHGFSTTLMMKLDSANQQILEQFVSVQKNLGLLLEQNNKITAKRAKHPLPCLWVLLPWAPQQDNLSWNISQDSEDMELKLLCDAAFDGEEKSYCSDFSRHDRIRVRRDTGFARKALAVLRCAAVVVKITDVAGDVLGIRLAEVVKRHDVGRSVEQVWSQQAQDDEMMDQTLKAVKQLASAVNETLTNQPNQMSQMKTEDKKTIVKVLHETSRNIRGWFQLVDKQQLVQDLFQSLDSNKKWSDLQVIGELHKIHDEYGNDRWVCPHHAGLQSVPAPAAAS